MGFFTRAAMDALMKTTHPEINRRQCWNLHPHRKSCTACKDICPYGDQIFTRPNLVKDWDPCTDCGLCVSVCRSRCISPSPEQVERDTSAADTDNDTCLLYNLTLPTKRIVEISGVAGAIKKKKKKKSAKMSETGERKRKQT